MRGETLNMIKYLVSVHNGSMYIQRGPENVLASVRAKFSIAKVSIPHHKEIDLACKTNNTMINQTFAIEVLNIHLKIYLTLEIMVVSSISNPSSTCG